MSQGINIAGHQAAVNAMKRNATRGMLCHKVYPQE